MGSFATYTFESGIYLLAGYLIYKWLLSTENQPAFNRLVLLSIYAMSFIAPLMRMPGFSRLANGVPGGVVAAAPVVLGIEPASAPEWALLCVMVYYAGMIAATVFTIISFVRLFVIICKGELHREGRYSLILLQDTKFATFSWLRYIVMRRADYKEDGEIILLHELAHLRLCHWVDLLLAQIVAILLWYNPAAWLMRAELRNVHEYQADAAVLQSGADARQYQLLLTKKAVGQRFPSLANSLNHSKLKNRITMMCNQKSSPVRRLRAVAIAPALLLAAVAVNNPSVASALGTASAVSLNESKVRENIPSEQLSSINLTAPEIMPEYPGGLPELFKFLANHVNYPARAAKKGVEGRVVVSFVVSPSGKATDIYVSQSVSPELDAEAIRVVSIMPTWTPASNNGTPVSCHMTLPVDFKIQKSEAPVTPKTEEKGIYVAPEIDPIVVVAY